MKRIYVLLLVIYIAAINYSCQENNKKVDTKKIEIGVVDSLFSDVLKEQRKIWVYVPKTDEHLSNTPKKFPVVYLLDGDVHFSSVVGMIEQLSTVNGNAMCPEMIVVGIPNTDRTRDLTPTNADTARFKTSGGAENFTKFIETELIPYIDGSYSTTSHRVIIGHSFGGLFVINALLNHSNLFTNYIAIDPSLWWDESKLLQQTVGQLKGEKYKNKSLFVAVANTMKKAMKISEVTSDTSKSTVHIRSILKFNESTRSNNDSSLTFRSKYYDNDTHSSVPLVATYDAIRFLYSWYDYESHIDWSDLPTIDVMLNDCKNHYANVSKRMGYEILPPEQMINGFGYYFIREKKYDYALRFIQMNIDNYPTSANAFDSMGDYFLAKGDTSQAIVNFEKALAINPNINYSKEKLEKLRKK